MSILLNKEKKRVIIYTLLCIIFSIIYELFSHGVISIFMCTSFIFPIILFIEDFIILKKKLRIINYPHNLFKSSIFTFTIYFIILAVLEIYGTTNKLVIVYPILGLILLLLSIVLYLKILYLKKN